MVRCRLLTGMIAAFLVVGIAMVNCAMAGEIHKAHGTSVATKFEQMKVGDEDGHILAIMEAKQIWIDDKTGEKSVGTSYTIMDVNMKTGQGSMTGYLIRTYPNGEKWFSKSEGRPVGPGLMKGTFTYTGGTGQYEGLHGKGTWESQMMGPGVAFMKAEGTRELGGQ